MIVHRNRIMLAAPKSGSGKTLLTTALLQAWKKTGKEVTAFKCGPDYIDPMFHRRVIGVQSRNLDSYFTGEEETRRLLIEGTAEEGYAVIEGVMGLYDGLAGISEKASSYELAKITKTPIVLVIDAKGMARSLLPMIRGFLQYDSAGLIRGVLLNRTSKGMYELLAPMIEQELGIRVLGYFPFCDDLHLESRHLGLQLPAELPGLKEQVELAGDLFQVSINMEELQKIAESAEALSIKEESREVTPCCSIKERPRIAVARDEAFCFYYEENLELLKRLGAELVFFSPLHDSVLPKGIQGLLLGGGYPELYARSLSENKSMRESVAEAIQSKMPCLSECGGFLYLHKELSDPEGNTYEMAGVIDAKGTFQGKLVRFGYVELTEQNPTFLQEGTSILGHEFHYYDSTENGNSCLATKPLSSKRWNCVLEGKHFFWGFPHLYYPSNPAFAEHFVKEAVKYGKLVPLF